MLVGFICGYIFGKFSVEYTKFSLDKTKKNLR